MKKLTKEEAVRLHRELWNWLAEHPNGNPRNWPEWPKIEAVYGYDNSNCSFACRYVAETYTYYSGCVTCPFAWPGISCIDGVASGDGKGLHPTWEGETDEIKRSALAAMIRDLPVRNQHMSNKHTYRTCRKCGQVWQVSQLMPGPKHYICSRCTPRKSRMYTIKKHPRNGNSSGRTIRNIVLIG